MYRKCSLDMLELIYMFYNEKDFFYFHITNFPKIVLAETIFGGLMLFLCQLFKNLVKL